MHAEEQTLSCRGPGHRRFRPEPRPASSSDRRHFAIALTPDTTNRRYGRELETAIRLMQEGQASEVAVLDRDDRLIGYIDRENLAEFMMIEDAEAQAAIGSVRGPVAG
jgi:hypothetical protein